MTITILAAKLLIFRDIAAICEEKVDYIGFISLLSIIFQKNYLVP